jgi:3-(3-hydroxy-phenyl)propionate hydroxylase
MRATPSDVDVAIVGCGPVGAVLGNLLGGLGVRVAIVERETEVYRLPRAVHFDGEIMRVFQSIGLAEAIAPCSAPITGMDFVDASGTRLMGYVAPPGVGPSGWASDYMFHQPDLERALREALDRYPEVELRLGTEVRALAPQDDHVEVVLPATTIRATYVVGTDGARSLTRAAIGSTLDDYGFDQPWLVVDAVRRRPLDLPTAVVQYCDPARPATFVPPGGPHCRWELMVLPGEDEQELLDPGRVADLLAPWIAPDDVEITRAAVYTFHALVAREWRRDRLLLAGDSAHQMPPFLGQGMCAGIRDAANLAWKLAAVLQDGAPDRLLDTYQSEREPHVRAVIESAVAAGSIIQTTDPGLAHDRDELLRADGGAEPPELALPPLGPGVHRSAGVPLPQCDGSDARLGPGPTLVAARPVGIDGVVVLPHLADWLSARDADVALVRPDRYVFGTAALADVDTLVGALRAHLV